MDNKDEALIIAEKTLRHLLLSADDANKNKMPLSLSYVKHTINNALAQINQLKQR